MPNALGLSDLRDRFFISSCRWVVIRKPNGKVTVHADTRRGRHNAEWSPATDRFVVSGVSAREARAAARQRWASCH